MLKLFFYLILITACAILVANVSSSPGDVSILWHGYRIDTSAGFLALLTLAAAACFTILFYILRLVFYTPHSIRRRKEYTRNARGLQVVTEALAALSASEAGRARALTSRAHKILGETAITHLLDAQLAKLEQDDTRVRASLEAMLGHTETRALAARNLAEYHLRLGHAEQALDYARKASALDPRNLEAARALFAVYIRLQQWQEADQFIDECRWKRILSRAKAKRWRGILALSRAQALHANNEIIPAIWAAQEAFKLIPELPATPQLYIELLIKNDDISAAQVVLKKAWKASPHPLLSEVALEIASRMKNEEARAFIQKLKTLHPDHPESALLMARIYMKDKNWNSARDLLKKVSLVGNDARIYSTLAEIEQDGFKDAEAAAVWLRKSAQAPQGEGWVCVECDQVSADWQACCPACLSADALVWKTPGAYKGNIHGALA